MKKSSNLILVMMAILLSWLVIVCSGCGGGSDGDVDSASTNIDNRFSHVTDERWVSSENFEITINAYNTAKIQLTSGHIDFKPVWSKTGDMITFFRAIFIPDYVNDFKLWKTKICVINADGTGFMELTNGEYAHFNPTWTRDGSNQIIFNRSSGTNELTNQIYLIDPNGEVGSEVLVSEPGYPHFEWAYSGLIDGRLFIDKRVVSVTGHVYKPETVKSYLLTPNPGRTGIYEEVSRPTTKPWHKLSVSPDETMVVYMLDNDENYATYNDVVLYYADFDKDSLTVYNPVAITELDINCVYEYPRFSSDGSLIVFDSNKFGTFQTYAYNIAEGTTHRISPDLSSNYRFVGFEDTPK